MSIDIMYTSTGRWEDYPVTRGLRDRMEKGGVAAASMKCGTWDWGDRKPPRHEDGTLRVPMVDVRVAAGWKRTNENANKYFAHKIFRDSFAREMQRIQGGVSAELKRIDELGMVRLDNILELLKHSMLLDAADPEILKKMSLQEKARVYGLLADKQAKEQGDFGTRASNPVGPGDLARQIAEKVSKQGAEVQVNQMKVTVPADAS